MSRWIANLPLRHKFALLSLVALLMAGAPSALVLSESVTNLQTLKIEALGLAPSKDLLALIRLTQEHRGLSSAALSGDASKQAARKERQAKVDQAFQTALDALSVLQMPDLSKELAALKADWQALSTEVDSGSLSAPVSTKRHTQLVSRQLLLLEDVVGDTGLALDADNECYYLITAAFRDLPRLTEKLGQSRAKGAAMLVKKDGDAAERLALGSLVDGMQMHALDASRDLEKSGVLKDAHAGDLPQTIDDARTALTHGHALIDQVLQTQDWSGQDSGTYFRDMTAVIGAQFKISDEVVTRLSSLLDERVAAEQRRVVMTILVIVFMLCLGAWLAITITRLTTRTVSGAVRVVNALAQGDLRQTMHSEHRDEIGELVRVMGTAMSQFRQTIMGIKSASESVATASSQIAQGNLDLSARTENQASSLQETAASMEEMSATVSNSASIAKEANQLAIQASVEATRSGETFSQVVHKMSDIQQASRKIADINAVIDGIAFQTNILALNAAVEAARAGEQGRGFAVVAAEVRALAQRSAQAAREIKSLISSSTDSVEVGYHLATETGHSIERLVSQVQQVSQLMAEIASGSEQQHLGIMQVNDAVSSLDQTTQQNAALVEESSAAAASLSAQARQLLQTVERFQLV